MSLSILILGGMTTLARPLLCFLTNLKSDDPISESKSISHIRVVDKFLIDSQGNGSVYVDPQAQLALKDPRVEYKQANLNIKSTLSSLFTPPSNISTSSSYDLVFDLTGEGQISSDVPAQLLLERTAKLAGQISSLSISTKVKALVRDTPPFMTSKPEEGLIKEGQMEGRKIKTHRSYWWYEAERAAANQESNLVILRSSNVWGSFQYTGAMMPRFIIAQIYACDDQDLELLWSPTLRANTLHALDWCSAAWKSALWMAEKGRKLALEEAGEDLPPLTLTAKESKKKREGEVDMDKDYEDCCKRNRTPKAVVFNLVDEGDTNSGKFAEIASQLFGIKISFCSTPINMYAKMNFESVVDDINEKHMALTNKLLEEAGFTGYTPLTAYIDPELLTNRAVALDGTKAQKVLGWKSSHPFNLEEARKVRDEFAETKTWLTKEDYLAAVKANKEKQAVNGS